MVAFTNVGDEPLRPDNSVYATEFTKLSQGIQQPNLPSGKALAFKGAEAAVTQGSEELDKAAGKYVENVTRDQTQATDTAYLGRVQNTYNQAFPNAGNANPDTLTPASAGAAQPPGVVAGIARMGTIEAAYNQGTLPGHLREYQRYADQYQNLQDLNSKYPGFRDHVAKSFEATTGIPANANQLIKTALADLNELITKKNEPANKVFNEMVSKGFDIPGFDQVIKDVATGKRDVWSAYHLFNTAMSYKYPAEVARAQMSTMELDDKQRQRVASDYITPLANNAASLEIDSLLSQFNLSQNKLAELASIQANGGRKRSDGTIEPMDMKSMINDETWARLGTAANLQYNSGRAAIVQRMNAPIPILDKDGVPTGQYRPYTMAQAAGTKIDEYLKGYDESWKRLIQAIHLPDIGLMHQTTRDLKALQDRTLFEELRAPTVTGQALRGMDVMRRAGGEQWGQWAPGMAKAINEANLTSLLAIHGSIANGDPFAFAKTMSGVLDTVASNTHEDPASIKFSATAPAQVVRSDSATIDEKLRTVRHAIQDSDDWLKKIAVENGVDVKSGRFDVFAAYTDPKFVEMMRELDSKSPNEHLFGRYQGWVERNFAVNLYGGELAALRNTAPEPGVKISWVKENGQAPKFIYQREPGMPMGRDPVTGQPRSSPYGTGTQYTPRFDPTQLHFQNLNKGLAAMYNVFGESTLTRILALSHGELTAEDAPGYIGQMVKALKAVKPIEGSAKPQDRAP